MGKYRLNVIFTAFLLIFTKFNAKNTQNVVFYELDLIIKDLTPKCRFRFCFFDRIREHVKMRGYYH